MLCISLAQWNVAEESALKIWPSTILVKVRPNAPSNWAVAEIKKIHI